MNIQQQRKYGKEAFYMDNQTYNSIVNFIWGIGLAP